jgi:hypothetical protein
MTNIGPAYYASTAHKALLAKHRELCGTFPNQTDDQKAHVDQTKHAKMHGVYPVRWDMSCPACDIRWST